IISRASGAPLITGAIRYAAQLVRGKVFEVAKKEFDAANKAGLKEILAARKASEKTAGDSEEVKAPPKEP
ncbi:glycine reductase, partial [[Clostridium] symbiosum]|nr:glycine reductase [[Clostridium] symbiosum]